MASVAPPVPPPGGGPPDGGPSGRQPPSSRPDWAEDINQKALCKRCSKQKPLWYFISKRGAPRRTLICLDCREQSSDSVNVAANESEKPAPLVPPPRQQVPVPPPALLNPRLFRLFNRPIFTKMLHNSTIIYKIVSS
ncbi:hypothetical protein Hte_003242 [Hypoxylon texense]